MNTHDFGNDAIRAQVAGAGAELVSLRFADGREMLWQAGPAWRRHAPVLFPIVGRLVDDTLTHQGFSGRLAQHGFARDREFAWEARETTGCRLSLRDDAETRRSFPFAFRLVLEYSVEGAMLAVTFTIENPGETVLPASIGVHPAFRWPLADGVPKEAHRLVFPMDENGPVRRLADGLLLPDPVPSPVAGRVLPLSDALFAEDAVILERPASTEVRYEATDAAAPAITVGWDGFETLGIWSKPADFVCIEPWSGFASPVGYRGPFDEKPGVLHVPPGGRVMRRMRISLHAPR